MDFTEFKRLRTQNEKRQEMIKAQMRREIHFFMTVIVSNIRWNMLGYFQNPNPRWTRQEKKMGRNLY